MKILSALCGLSAFLSFAKLGECSQFTNCQGDDSNLIFSAELDSENQVTTPAELDSGFQVNRSPAEFNSENQVTRSRSSSGSSRSPRSSSSSSCSPRSSGSLSSSNASETTGYEVPWIVFSGLKRLDTLLELHPETEHLFLTLGQLKNFAPREGLELGLKFKSSQAELFESAHKNQDSIRETISKFKRFFERKTGGKLRHCLAIFNVNRKLRKLFLEKGIDLHEGERWMERRDKRGEYRHLCINLDTRNFISYGDYILGDEFFSRFGSTLYPDEKAGEQLENETSSPLKGESEESDSDDDVGYDLLSDFEDDAVLKNTAELKA